MNFIAIIPHETHECIHSVVIILFVLFLFIGSPTDHSPVLNLSKSGGGSAGSLGDGDHSGSEADGPDVPPSPRSPRSAAEDDEDDNISEPEEEDEKDQGKCRSSFSI